MKQTTLPPHRFDQVRRRLALLTHAASIACAVGFPTIALVGCSTSPKVYTQPKPGADFTRYHTFALMPLPTTGPATDPGLMLRVAEPARRAAVEALTAKGLIKTDPDKADLAINLRGQFLPKVAVTQYGYVPGPGFARRGGYVGAYAGVDVNNYEERTLTIEVFDNHTKELTWVGWSKRDTTGEVDVEKLQSSIRGILSQLPAGTAATPR